MRPMQVGILTLLPLLIYAKVNPNVCLETGACYEGTWYLDVNDGLAAFASFQGIRYAQAPTGNLRFKPPILYLDEEGTYDVSSEQCKTCPQLGNNGSVIGSEDCLFLNVYVPDTAFDNPEFKLPVMVYFHGGALTSGNNWYANYGPKHFTTKDVLVVVVNYRLGPIGFLSLGTKEVPGNAGFRDQSLALSWVQDNIGQFGGDPDSVTIFGESAGAVSVMMHLLSPISEGLFRRAIVQSGTGISPGKTTLTPQQALDQASHAYEYFGCDQTEDKLECLQSKDLEDLIRFPLSSLGAVNDMNFTSEPFLTAMPEKTLADGTFNTNIEVIVGTNANEGLIAVFAYIKDPSKWEAFRQDFDTTGTMLMFNILPEDLTEEDVQKAHKVAEFYVGGVENFDENHLEKTIDMWTDALFTFSNYKLIQYLTKWGIPTFQYVLTFEGQYSFSQNLGIEPMGVCHVDDLLYLFDPNPVLRGVSLNETEMLLRETMTTTWTNFAKFGDPTPPSESLHLYSKKL